MKPVIVISVDSGIVECISNPTDAEIVLRDYDIQDTDQNYSEYDTDENGDFMIIHFPPDAPPPKPQHGREPEKVKPLAQYLDEYIEHEADELGNISVAVGELYAYNSWRELLEQALDAYESTENVTIKIERV